MSKHAAAEFSAWPTTDNAASCKSPTPHAARDAAPANAPAATKPSSSEPRKTAPKHILRGALPIVLALALALPWSSDPEAWQAVNYWKIFGLLVLFHLIFCHLQIPEFLKNNNKP